MTKTKTSLKVLKATMIGAVALTPVLAIGAGVDKAEAASQKTVNDLITDLNKAFDSLKKKDSNKTDKLVEAHDKIKSYLTKEKANLELAKLLSSKVTGERKTAAEDVVGALVTFMAHSTTGYKMEEAFTQFKKEATDAKIKKAFADDTLSQDLFVQYLIDVQNEALSKMEGGSYKDKFISALKDVSKSTAYLDLAFAIGDTVKIDEVGNVLDNIITNSGIEQHHKDAFVALAKEYKEVTKDEGDTTNPSPSNPGVVFPPTTPPTINVGSVEVDGSTIGINPQAVIDAIEKAAKIEKLIIKVAAGSTEVEIPATILAALNKKNSNAVIVLQFGDVSYELPVSAFDLAAIAKDLDVASAELKLKVSVKKVDNPLASKAAYKVLADAYDFNVSVVAPGGKSVALTVFPTPIKRTLPAAAKLNAATTVGVTVDAKGKVTAVPTYVSGDTTANLYRSTNSVYTLIEHSKSFTDITKGTSWAEEYVDKLASRMVVNGKTQTTFAPTLKITRGEFAAILSRGLGIVAMDKTAKSFKDVSASQAFNQNGEIAAVVEAGIVAGYKDGSFRPYEEITRDQAAIMISRAIDYVGADKVTFDTKKALTAFKDSKEIGAASRKHVERVYQAGLLDGYLDETFRPNADANRGQMAKIIYNFLAEIKFIN